MNELYADSVELNGRPDGPRKRSERTEEEGDVETFDDLEDFFDDESSSEKRRDPLRQPPL